MYFSVDLFVALRLTLYSYIYENLLVNQIILSIISLKKTTLPENQDVEIFDKCDKCDSIIVFFKSSICSCVRQCVILRVCDIVFVCVAVCFDVCMCVIVCNCVYMGACYYE